MECILKRIDTESTINGKQIKIELLSVGDIPPRDLSITLNDFESRSLIRILTDIVESKLGSREGMPQTTLELRSEIRKIVREEIASVLRGAINSGREQM